MEGADQSNPCAICLGAMGAGGGQAIFTAECSHTFHFQCISTSVAHGHLVCPLCNARWRELPFVQPPQPASMPPLPPGWSLPQQQPMLPVQPLPQQQPLHATQPQQPPTEPEAFDDDEPVEPSSGHDHDGQRPAAAASSGTLVVKTHTEYSALARDTSHDNFAVVVHVKAPGMIDGEAASGDAPRAPLDLVTVLDVSGSMNRNKLDLVKQAMVFLIGNLGPDDRLSVVSFSSVARRVTRLLRMSDAGKSLAIGAVESLVAGGATNIAEGLRTAAKVLDERRHRNAVSSVILLSDGQDNCNNMHRRARSGGPTFEALVPASLVPTGAGDRPAPIHTFGFGNDHDAAAMHVIAEVTGGTFSFVENEAVIQDAFAQCIGGLLTVVVQDARIGIACGHPGVRIVSVKSGHYESRVEEDGRAASVRVGELYADEERRFLLFMAVPTAEAAGGETETTTLIKVTCTYRHAAGGADVVVTAEDTVVLRPEQVADAERSVEVERERVRVEAIEAIAAARAAAERGAHQEAAEILENRQRAVARSAAAGGGYSMNALGAELRHVRRRVMNRESYARSGRAHVLSALSTHLQQRGNTRQLQADGGGEAAHSAAAASMHMNSAVSFGGWEAMNMSFMAFPSGPGGEAWASNMAAPEGMSNEAAAAAAYATPAMHAMLLRSRRAREGEAPAEQLQPPPEAGGGAGSSEAKEVDKVAGQ
ncbi:hypothetical protein ACP70R_002032 [Stipagrostis hirtigluma subsp. patula]